eukprot:Hpha_TRINITY_DN23478_c0_g1::TRINITY_DN23478_c0_g1_i1::g.113949::m.113949
MGGIGPDVVSWHDPEDGALIVFRADLAPGHARHSIAGVYRSPFRSVDLCRDGRGQFLHMPGIGRAVGLPQDESEKARVLSDLRRLFDSTGVRHSITSPPRTSLPQPPPGGSSFPRQRDALP